METREETAKMTGTTIIMKEIEAIMETMVIIMTEITQEMKIKMEIIIIGIEGIEDKMETQTEEITKEMKEKMNKDLTKIEVNKDIKETEELDQENR